MRLINKIKDNLKIKLLDIIEWREFSLNEIFYISGSKTTLKQKLEEIGNEAIHMQPHRQIIIDVLIIIIFLDSIW